MKKFLIISPVFLLLPSAIMAQRQMTLQEAIGTARSQFVAALQAKHAFVSTYWAYRSLPSAMSP